MVAVEDPRRRSGGRERWVIRALAAVTLLLAAAPVKAIDEDAQPWTTAIATGSGPGCG